MSRSERCKSSTNQNRRSRPTGLARSPRKSSRLRPRLSARSDGSRSRLPTLTLSLRKCSLYRGQTSYTASHSVSCHMCAIRQGRVADAIAVNSPSTTTCWTTLSTLASFPNDMSSRSCPLRTPTLVCLRSVHLAENEAWSSAESY